MAVVCYYCTGHGLGHATRTVEVIKELLSLEGFREIVLVSSLPTEVFACLDGDRFRYRQLEQPLDCGGIQSDAFKVEPLETLQTYHGLCGSEETRQCIVSTETAWLSANEVSFVLSDSVPIACRCAREAGIPNALVTNLVWDFIYSEMKSMLDDEHVPQLEAVVDAIASDYACATFLFRLPGATPMPVFDGRATQVASMAEALANGLGKVTEGRAAVIEMPFVVRKPVRSREETRAALGIGPSQKILLLSFGGLSGSVSLHVDPETLPEGWVCAVCHGIWPATDSDIPRDKFLRLPKDAYLPDVIDVIDVILGKIGYGSVSECVVLRKPLIYVKRANFAEEPYLRAVLETHGNALELSREDFCAGKWRGAIERADKLRPTFAGDANGGRRCAEAVAAYLGLGKSDTTHQKG